MFLSLLRYFLSLEFFVSKCQVITKDECIPTDGWKKLRKVTPDVLGASDIWGCLIEQGIWICVQFEQTPDSIGGKTREKTWTHYLQRTGELTPTLVRESSVPCLHVNCVQPKTASHRTPEKQVLSHTFLSGTWNQSCTQLVWDLISPGQDKHSKHCSKESQFPNSIHYEICEF